jgi:hypothetical protein
VTYSSTPHTLPGGRQTYVDAVKHIYHEAQLTAFLETVPCNDDVLREPGWDFSRISNQESIKRVRFLLNTDNKLCFARSEAPTRDIPAHSQMAKENSLCLAAGDFYFAKIADRWMLIGASNKSGDFRPGIQSLQFALLRLQEQSTPFSAHLQIEVQGEAWLGCFSRVFQFNIEEINEYLLKLAFHLQSDKDHAIQLSGDKTPKKPKRLEEKPLVVQPPPLSKKPKPPALPTPQPQQGPGQNMAALFAAVAVRSATAQAALLPEHSPALPGRKLF